MAPPRDDIQSSFRKYDTKDNLLKYVAQLKRDIEEKEAQIEFCAEKVREMN